MTALAGEARPEITVAIPAFNGARHLGEALAGILAQRGAAFDLLVCDDRSDDDTLDVVREVAGDRVRVAVNSERLGLAGNWNRCVVESATDLVAIFHQDDVMFPGHLADHAAAFRDHPGLGMVCGGADVIDEAGSPVAESVVGRGDLGPSDRLFGAGEFVAELTVENPVRCSAVTIRREAHAAVGGFDPRYRYVVDWEFWLRLARRYEVAWLRRPTVAIRWHPASETHRFRHGTDDLDEQAELIAGVLHQIRNPERARLRRRADRRLARAYRNRAYEAARTGNSALVRRCLQRALSRWPGVLGTIAADPRLAARLALGLSGIGPRPR